MIIVIRVTYQNSDYVQAAFARTHLFLRCNSQTNGGQVVNQTNAVTRLQFSVFYVCAAALECNCVEYAYFQETGSQPVQIVKNANKQTNKRRCKSQAIFGSHTIHFSQRSKTKRECQNPVLMLGGHEKYPGWAIKDPWGGRQSISSGKAFSLHSFADQCQGRRRKGPPTHALKIRGVSLLPRSISSEGARSTLP